MGKCLPGTCCVADPYWIDHQTMVRGRTSPADPHVSADLRTELDLLNSTALNFATRFINDDITRQRYLRDIRNASDEILKRVHDVQVTPRDGAEEARLIRGKIMDASRLQTSDLGQARAYAKKPQNKSLAELEEYYAQNKFQRSMTTLNEAERNEVWLEIVKSSGRDNVGETLKVARLGKFGKGLIFVSIAISVYVVATAPNKAEAAKREGAGLAGGFTGGAVGGAVAGLACGPGAPVCSTVLIFVFGALGAWGGDSAYSSFANKR